MIDDKCWSRTDRWIIHDKWNHDEFSHECLTNDNERGQIIMSQWYPNPLLTRQVFVQPHVQRRPQSPSQHLSNNSLQRDKTLSALASMTSWLIHRDPYNGVPYSWVVLHPLFRNWSIKSPKMGKFVLQVLATPRKIITWLPVPPSK